MDRVLTYKNLIYLLNLQFYYATIAYHVGLNAVLGWPPGIMANVLEKRHLLLAVASSCHVITSDQSPYFLAGHVELVAVCKYTFSFISQLLLIVGGSFLDISFII